MKQYKPNHKVKDQLDQQQNGYNGLYFKGTPIMITDDLCPVDSVFWMGSTTTIPNLQDYINERLKK